METIALVAYLCVSMCQYYTTDARGNPVPHRSQVAGYGQDKAAAFADLVNKCSQLGDDATVLGQADYVCKSQ